MQTIDKILLNYWLNRDILQEKCRKYGCNGCGWKWGIDFENLLKSFPKFREDKWKKLLQDLHLICNLHDIWFAKGGWYIDFIKANWLFAKNVKQLVHWTNKKYRWALFVFVFLLTTCFGWKYFNWNKK